MQPPIGTIEGAYVSTILRVVHSDDSVTTARYDVVGLANETNLGDMLTKVWNRSFLIRSLGVPNFYGVIGGSCDERLAITFPG